VENERNDSTQYQEDAHQVVEDIREDHDHDAEDQTDYPPDQDYIASQHGSSPPVADLHQYDTTASVSAIDTISSACSFTARRMELNPATFLGKMATAMIGFEHMKTISRVSASKIVLLVMDGVGGLPHPETGKTELETARTTNLNRIARESLCGSSTRSARE
jgi:hypothetical protein